MSSSHPPVPSPPPSHRWPRRIRLRKRRDFAQIQRMGARAGGTLMVVLCRKTRSKDAPGRMGFAVSKKVGNAPVRNLIKRRLRHLARTQKSTWSGLDVVLLIQPPAADATFEALGAALVDGISRAQRALEKGKGKRHRGSSQKRTRKGGSPEQGAKGPSPKRSPPPKPR